MLHPIHPELEAFSDIKLRVDIEIGRTHKMLIEILSLKEGDIIELEKSTEEYINVNINHKPFAIGELVIANEKYGVRIVDLAK